MGNPPVLKRLTNNHRAFYPTLGPFLSRRAIVKEIGGPIWDDDNKTWWVALRGKTVLGFAAARDDTRHITFQSAYTLPDYRRQGIYRTLLQARLDVYTGHPIRAVCTPASLPVLLAHGFVVVRARGSYTEVTYAR